MGHYLHDYDVRCGSWPCENAKTLNRDRRTCSSETVLVAQRASGFNLEIELKNIILRRVSIFEFLHSQGQTRKCPCLHGTSVVPSRADVVRPPRHVRPVPSVDGSELARGFFTFCRIGRCSHVFGL